MNAFTRRVRSEWRTLHTVRLRHPRGGDRCRRCKLLWPCPTVRARRTLGEADNPWPTLRRVS